MPEQLNVLVDELAYLGTTGSNSREGRPVSWKMVYCAFLNSLSDQKGLPVL